MNYHHKITIWYDKSIHGLSYKKEDPYIIHTKFFIKTHPLLNRTRLLRKITVIKYNLIDFYYTYNCGVSYLLVSTRWISKNLLTNSIFSQYTN